MRSTWALGFLVCALSIPGCKKHGEANAGASEAGGSGDGGMDAAADAASATSEAGADDAAAADAGPEAAPGQDTDNTSSPSFSGAYDCWGGSMTLTQTGTQVAGTAHIHLGTVTQAVDVLCKTQQASRCVGQATYFSQKGDHSPKPAGRGKLIFSAQPGGLHYMTTHGGTQQGFCPKK